MTQTVTALYDAYEPAVSAVNALEASGIPHSDISIVSSNIDNQHNKDCPTNTAKDAGVGAGIGAAVGGIGGLLTGLGLLAIPGVGPVVAGGWLVATAAGAMTGTVAGGVTGGLVGSLSGAGVPQHDANFYAEGVRRGGTLVTARVEDAQAATAREILQRFKSVDPAVRGAAYRQGGWTAFDEQTEASGEGSRAQSVDPREPATVENRTKTGVCRDGLTGFEISMRFSKIVRQLSRVPRSRNAARPPAAIPSRHRASR